jgi:hypothetical protein
VTGFLALHNRIKALEAALRPQGLTIRIVGGLPEPEPKEPAPDRLLPDAQAPPPPPAPEPEPLSQPAESSSEGCTNKPT